MNSISPKGPATPIASAGHAVFAASLIGLGILGLIKSDYTAIWQPIPGRSQLLVYLCSFIFLIAGIGLLRRRTATIAARILLGYLLLWLLLVRLPTMVMTFRVDYWWAVCKIAVMAAAAWALFFRLATDSDRRRFGFAAGNGGLCIARVLYGIAMIHFGIAHFVYLQNTASLVPAWLPGPVAWSYFTGWAFIAAGLAVIVGVFARLGAVLSAVQIGGFTLLVWGPFVFSGSKNIFKWNETFVSVALTAAAWVVADSYRRVPWLAVDNPFKTNQAGLAEES